MQEFSVRILFDALTRHRRELQTLALALWEHPELAWQEEFAVRTLGEFFHRHGFAVESGWLGFPTAFKAECGDRPGPVFAIAAEYDALPEIGHGCGHNLIAAAAAAAALAVRQRMEETGLSGRLTVLGTPAEESGGGKVKMLEKGCLDGVDAVMMLHPSWRTVPDTGSTAIKRCDVDFFGSPAHAATAPELGVNALDACMLLFAGVNAFRQQMPEFCRIHGVVRQGGEMPNIIPDHAACRFYLRSTSDEWLDKLDRRFRAIVDGAAMMTGATSRVTPYSIAYRARRPNAAMNERFLRNMEALGVKTTVPASGGRGSSDFGDFSHRCPAVHPYFGISDHEIPAHSREFAMAARSDAAIENMLRAAAAMADIALEYLGDPGFRAAVNRGFTAD